jgi:7-cyano-7-deazaguanine synthase
MSADTVILLSGGLDSSTLLARAVHEGRTPLCLTFTYGQRHYMRELNASREIAEHYGVRRQVIDLRQSFAHMAKASWLTGADTGSVVVPGRNGILLSIAAGVTESIGATEVWFGANRDDSQDFPDCRPDWVDAMSEVVALGSRRGVALVAPYVRQVKAQIVRDAIKLRVPLDLTHTCYEGSRPACGQCQACATRKRAFHKALKIDPLVYAEATRQRGGTDEQR